MPPNLTEAENSLGNSSQELQKEPNTLPEELEKVTAWGEGDVEKQTNSKQTQTEIVTPSKNRSLWMLALLVQSLFGYYFAWDAVSHLIDPPKT